MDNETYKGLSENRAQELLITYGKNEISETRKFVVIKALISQFNNFLMLLLIASAGISLFVGEHVDALFIGLIVVLNALFGFYQEFKAEKALDTLKQLTVTTVRVLRDGIQREIDSRLLVPGDVVYLEQGARVPADARVVQAWHLEVNEASLTGESVPVEKNVADEERNRIFLGTIISVGRCTALIEETGDNTRFGKMAKTLAEIKETQTPLQIKLEQFTKQLGVIGIAASVVVFLLSFLQEKTMIESFIFAVSLAVAAVPEGLPAVMTITLAIGVETMARKKAIVRKLNSIEALGSLTLLATDKTGTLTTNRMIVKRVWVNRKNYTATALPNFTNPTFKNMLLNGVLCSTASIVMKVKNSFDVLGDTTEGAMLILAHKFGLVAETVKPQWEIVDEKPFDSGTRRMTVAVKNKKSTLVFTKGAPESILEVCDRIEINGKAVNFSDDLIREVETEFREYAKKGLRTLAFSYKTKYDKAYETQQIFLGFVGIADPMREGVQQAVTKARQAGIKIVMITGDNELTAQSIGLESGIIKEGEDILTGKQLDGYKDADLLPLLQNIRIFARTSPEHKLRLVKLFQKTGEVVAVTGDGVNDALALKQADVGVAMGITGTDVAKETADMVITDDNFATIVNSIEEGRNIFYRIKNAIKFLLACNLGEVVYILVAVALHLPVLTPLQILYINLATDGLPAISLAFSPYNGDVMKENPKKNQSILDSSDMKKLFAAGSIVALLSYVSTLPYVKLNNHDVAGTVLFTTIILVQHFLLLDAWISHKPLHKHFSSVFHPIFLAAFLLPVIVHPILLYTPLLNEVFRTVPLTASQLSFSVLVSFLMLGIIESRKAFGKRVTLNW